MPFFPAMRAGFMTTGPGRVPAVGAVPARRSAGAVLLVLALAAASGAQSGAKSVVVKPVVVKSVAVKPVAGAPAVAPTRGVYLWRAAERIHGAHRVCEVTRRIGGTALYVAASRRLLEGRDSLAGFLSAATAARLESHAVLSENTWALTSRHAAGLERVDRILAWNRAQGEATRFVGLQLDIEVHALPAFKAAKRARRSDPESATPVIRKMLREWLDWNAKVAARVEKAGSKLPVGVAVPHWFLKPGADYSVSWRGRTCNVVDHLLDLVDEVVVMAYVDSPRAAAKLAADEVVLADPPGRRGRVRVALSVSPRGEAGTSLFAGKWKALVKALAATDQAYAGRRGYAGTAIHMWSGLARLDAERDRD